MRGQENQEHCNANFPTIGRKDMTSIWKLLVKVLTKDRVRKDKDNGFQNSKESVNPHAGYGKGRTTQA